MESMTRYVLAQRAESIDEGYLADEMLGWAFEDEKAAKQAANFGARLAPQSQVFKVTIYVEEIK